MPKLWNATIEEHRRAVRDAALDAASRLVAGHGLRAATMSRIAETAGIGRATLYKYFPDVDAILRAWQEREITRHLDEIAELLRGPGRPIDRLAAVLQAYARNAHGSRRHHGADLAGILHGEEQVGRAQLRLFDMLRDLLTEAGRSGDVRDDVPPGELAAYCMHALAAAASLPSDDAMGRLVAVTLAGLRPPG